MERVLLSLRRNIAVLGSYLQRKVRLRWAAALIIFWIILTGSFDWQQLFIGVLFSFFDNYILGTFLC